MVFYKTLFASLCFIAFGIALAARDPKFFAAALLFGAAYMTAKKKSWKDPDWFAEWAGKRDKK